MNKRTWNRGPQIGRITLMTDVGSTFSEYDLFTPDVFDDPLPLLRRIRDESPVAAVPQLGGYLITRHADIVAALKDKRLQTANMTQGLERMSPAEQEELQPVLTTIRHWMGHTNPTDHVRFQQLLKRYFTPSTVNGLRPQVREITLELLDRVEADGRMDVVRDLAYPLPANVIADMLGMPAEHRERLQAWSRDIAAVFGVAELEGLRQSQRSILEMQDYLRPLVADRRQHPRDDILTMFAEAQQEGVVTEDEIVANCVLLLFAGHETTAGLIANGLLLLFDNPEAFARLRAEPELTPSAVEEMLRCDGPAGSIVRLSGEQVEVAGHAFPAGTLFHLSVLIGNRDPEVFPNPDVFDITRKANRHTSFGLGAFYCLGAALARVEADECFRILLQRFPTLRPTSDKPDRDPRQPLSRHLRSLSVEW